MTLANMGVLENIITLLVSVGAVTGFYYMTGSGWSFLWLLLFLNMNRIGSSK